VNASNLSQWPEAGAIGIGIGNDLYKSGDTITQVKSKLAAISSALLNYNDRSH